METADRPPAPAVLEVDTPHGTARAHVVAVDSPVAALVLGHGAAGSVTARDLVAVAAAARGEQATVVLVEQPYRVAGRKSPPPARRLDAAWTAVIGALRAGGPLDALPLVTGGRSSGARVACRTAADVEAAGVLCLAFPLLAPPRSAGGPRQSRLPELDAVAVPTLVVQGGSDRFGMPPPAPHRTVVEVQGDHRLTSDLGAVAGAVRAWLPRVIR